ncbi:MAG: hypothetical protein KBS52_00015, partial [Clostridiales bacterium]|nr:hypothetical protein [Candidatus Equinaster intestinalis]
NTLKAFSDLEIYRIKAENAAAGTKCTNITEAKEMLESIGEVSSGENPTKLKEQFAATSEQKARLENRLTELTTRAKTAFGEIKTPIEYEKEVAEINEKIALQKQYYERLKTVEELLLKASAQLRRNFSGALESRTLEIFSGITGARYTDVSVSKNFDINLQNDTDFGAHNAGLLSRGTADQAYFALRLALSEMIGKENGGLPIFLDDVFSQYDDKREAEGFKYLRDYSKNAQIVFFTCHGEDRRNAQNSGANVIEM